MFMVKIESYGDIFLYFCEIRDIFGFDLIRPRSMSINLTNMAPVNGYKLDKYGPGQWV